METDESLALPPKYWKYEGGALGPAVLHYLTAESLTPEDIVEIAKYLRNWIESPFWERMAERSCLKGGRHQLDAVWRLRIAVRGIYTRRDIENWQRVAAAIGIDPF